METVFAHQYTLAANLHVSDEDAADFLQSQFTQDLRPFAAGQCTYGLWLDVRGKVIADSFVLCEGGEEPRFRILSIGSDAASIMRQLERHIIADDVRIDSLPEAVGIALVGSGAASFLKSLGFEGPADGHFTSSEGICIFAGRRSSGPSYELFVESFEVAADLRSRIEAQGVAFVESDAMQLERIRSGIPLIPAEVGPTDLPGEGGLELDAVSFTKGCYLGQEVVARMHHVGRPQRALYVVSGVNAPPVCPSPLLNEAGKKIGELRSAYRNGDGHWTGVGLCKIRFVESGTELRHDGILARIERPLRVVGKDFE